MPPITYEEADYSEVDRLYDVVDICGFPESDSEEEEDE